MIFSHTHEMVLGGKKTQTRRIRKYMESKYKVGKTYSVQPGRGQRSIARILITKVRIEDVREISDDDIRAEGFESFADFMDVWLNMHHHDVWLQIQKYRERMTGKILDEFLRGYLRSDRDTDRYHAWVYDFKLVQF